MMLLRTHRRKVQRRVGETDASFKSRNVSVTEQSMVKERGDVAVSKRGLSVDEHFAQFGHHNERQRAKHSRERAH